MIDQSESASDSYSASSRNVWRPVGGSASGSESDSCRHFIADCT